MATKHHVVNDLDDLTPANDIRHDGLIDEDGQLILSPSPSGFHLPYENDVAQGSNDDSMSLPPFSVEIIGDFVGSPLRFPSSTNSEFQDNYRHITLENAKKQRRIDQLIEKDFYANYSAEHQSRCIGSSSIAPTREHPSSSQSRVSSVTDITQADSPTPLDRRQPSQNRRPQTIDQKYTGRNQPRPHQSLQSEVLDTLLKGTQSLLCFVSLLEQKE